jgi:hypothetical protein
MLKHKTTALLCKWEVRKWLEGRKDLTFNQIARGSLSCGRMDVQFRQPRPEFLQMEGGFLMSARLRACIVLASLLVVVMAISSAGQTGPLQAVYDLDWQLRYYLKDNILYNLDWQIQYYIRDDSVFDKTWIKRYYLKDNALYDWDWHRRYYIKEFKTPDQPEK